MRVKLHEEWSSVAPFGAPDMLTDFTPDRIAILKSDGTVVAERSNPREAFEGHDQKTPWDPLHRAYFNGYALWTYLTTPFLLAMNRVQKAEIEPWHEGAETWRVLRALFPSTIASHSTVQDFFFGEDLLLRRHDYNVDAAQLVFAYGSVRRLQDVRQRPRVGRDRLRRLPRNQGCHPSRGGLMRDARRLHGARLSSNREFRQ